MYSHTERLENYSRVKQTVFLDLTTRPSTHRNTLTGDTARDITTRDLRKFLSVISVVTLRTVDKITTTDKPGVPVGRKPGVLLIPG